MIWLSCSSGKMLMATHEVSIPAACRDFSRPRSDIALEPSRSVASVLQNSVLLLSVRM